MTRGHGGFRFPMDVFSLLWNQRTLKHQHNTHPKQMQLTPTQLHLPAIASTSFVCRSSSTHQHATVHTQHLLKSALFLFLQLALSFHVSGQSEKAEAEIRAIMGRHQVVGLSVVVVKAGDILYTKAFGLRDIETREPLQENNVFRIASISKSFSATSIMQLVEAGKVALDDDFSGLVGFPVRNPKFPDKVITLKMVLSHTSSINDSQGYFKFDVIDPAKNPDWAKCYNDYAPGEGWEYCNLNFNMVGAVIEKLSGERFDTYVAGHVLRPLGLHGGYNIDSLDNTLFATLHDFDSATGFVPSPQAYASRSEQISDYTMGYTTPIFSPTGGMKISASDLARFMIMHLNYGERNGVRIISKKSAKTIQKPVARKQGYGLAITTTDKLIAGQTMKGHTGSAYGLYSAMFFHPKEKLGFIVITNGCNPSYTNGFVSPLKETIESLYKNFIAEENY